MALLITQGQAIVGSLVAKNGPIDARSGLTIGSATKITYFAQSSVTISPANSSVAASGTEERSYTTGLTSLNLAAGDLVSINPKTALASSLFIGSVRVQSANVLHVLWGNAGGNASSGFATDYVVGLMRA